MKDWQRHAEAHWAAIRARRDFGTACKRITPQRTAHEALAALQADIEARQRPDWIAAYLEHAEAK